MESRNIAILVGVVVAVTIAGARLRQPSEKVQVERAVAAVNATLPKQIDEITTQTHLAVDDHLITSSYKITQTVDNDAVLVAALRKTVLDQACAKPETKKMLSLGYSLDNVYDVNTPHGPGQMRVLVKPTDCS